MTRISQLTLPLPDRRHAPTPVRRMRVAGLFAGIGGFELGFERAGHETVFLCEVDRAANQVLADRFPSVERHGSVRSLEDLPSKVDLITAGFPCQDLSQAGRTAGIDGNKSGLVSFVFKLLRRRQVEWLLLENVPFMLQLGKGRGLERITRALERLGYKWAYREIDSRAFGLPQRRRRVFILASLGQDPRRVLLADDAGAREEPKLKSNLACGFYWTEGNTGLGLAVDAVPTLKAGSAIGIPSPPGILLPSGDLVTPNIADAERLQGFPEDWTAPALQVTKGKRYRWKLVGNAVTVDVAEWIGRRIAKPAAFDREGIPVHRGARWPRAAWNIGDGRFACPISAWPVERAMSHLHAFLQGEHTPLSFKAAAGFLSRLEASNLNVPPRLMTALRRHVGRHRKRA